MGDPQETQVVNGLILYTPYTTENVMIKKIIYSYA